MKNLIANIFSFGFGKYHRTSLYDGYWQGKVVVVEDNSDPYRHFISNQEYYCKGVYQKQIRSKKH